MNNVTQETNALSERDRLRICVEQMRMQVGLPDWVYDDLDRVLAATQPVADSKEREVYFERARMLPDPKLQLILGPITHREFEAHATFVKRKRSLTRLAVNKILRARL